MKSHSVNIMGSKRSYWDFLFGSGLFVTIFVLAFSVLFWQLGSFAKANAASIKPMVVLFALTFFATAVVWWNYFFIEPAIAELLIAACLAMAFFRITA